MGLDQSIVWTDYEIDADEDYYYIEGSNVDGRLQKAAMILGLIIGLNYRVEFDCKKGCSWDLQLCRDGEYLLQGGLCGEEIEIRIFRSSREAFSYLKTLV